MLGRRHPRGLARMVGLHAAAATAGLAGPLLLGALVQSVAGRHDAARTSTRSCSCSPPACSRRPGFTFLARRASFVLSERMFAELREDFMRRVLALPLSTVERAGTGDLISRTTADVDALARTIRFARARDADRGGDDAADGGRGGLGQPARRAALRRRRARALGRHALVPPLRARPATSGSAPPTPRSAAPSARRWRAAARSRPSVCARSASRRIDADLAEAYRAERRTLYLRTMWFPQRRVRLRDPGRGRARLGRVARLGRAVPRSAR